VLEIQCSKCAATSSKGNLWRRGWLGVGSNTVP